MAQSKPYHHVDSPFSRTWLDLGYQVHVLKRGFNEILVVSYDHPLQSCLGNRDGHDFSSYERVKTRHAKWLLISDELYHKTNGEYREGADISNSIDCTLARVSKGGGIYVLGLKDSPEILELQKKFKPHFMFRQASHNTYLQFGKIVEDVNLGKDKLDRVVMHIS